MPNGSTRATFEPKCVPIDTEAGSGAELIARRFVENKVECRLFDKRHQCIVQVSPVSGCTRNWRSEPVGYSRQKQ